MLYSEIISHKIVLTATLCKHCVNICSKIIKKNGDNKFIMYFCIRNHARSDLLYEPQNIYSYHFNAGNIRTTAC